jgi:putative membrane protein
MFTFFATMGLELLAGEIEEPFGTDRNDLPLDQLAERIAADVQSLLSTGEAARRVTTPAPSSL